MLTKHSLDEWVGVCCSGGWMGVKVSGWLVGFECWCPYGWFAILVRQLISK